MHDVDTALRIGAPVGGAALPEHEQSRPRHYLRWWVRRPRLLLFGGIILAMITIGIFADVIVREDPTKTHPAQAALGWVVRRLPRNQLM